MTTTGEWLCLTFLLTMVTVSPVVTEPISAIIGAAAAAISAGTSLAGTTMSGLMSTGYSVTCGIEVENWSKFPLTHPHVELGDGAVSTPPTSILPSKREAMITHKIAHLATGTYGTVSWLISGQNRRAVIMWSAPYNFNHYSNWMGVGITRVGVTTHEDGWFNLMYYSRSNYQLGFDRKKYYYSVSTVLYRDKDFEIRGTMGTSHQALVKVIVIPLNEDNMAAPVKTLLQYKRQIGALLDHLPMKKTLADHSA